MYDQDDKIGYMMKMLAEGKIKVDDSHVKNMWMKMMQEYCGDFRDEPTSKDPDFESTVQYVKEKIYTAMNIPKEMLKDAGVSEEYLKEVKEPPKPKPLVFTIKVPKRL